MGTEINKPFSNKPETVMNGYRSAVERSRLHPHIPSPGQINRAEKILGTMKHTMTAEVIYKLGQMLGRETITYGKCNTVDLLIHLLENKKEIIPQSWLDHPDKIRTVLGVAASQDIGILNADHIHFNGDKDLSTEESRTHKDSSVLKKLVEDLFSRVTISEPGGVV